MNTLKMSEGFAIWVTGLPASGKTVLAEAIKKRLYEWYEIKIVHFESDQLRNILTPEPTYSVKERDWFYGVMVYFGRMLTSNGINVIFDATGNRKVHRSDARSSIVKFMEVYVRCPLGTCMKRDPKGIYKMAQTGMATTVPGIQNEYEEPESPELIIDSDKISPDSGAEHVIAKMKEKGWV